MSEKWIKLAVEIAQNAPKPDCPIACILVLNESEIARSINEVEARNDPTAHAEILCIQKACSILGRRNLSDCILYCTLEPCPMCEEAIKLARIKEVVFGAFRSRNSNPCSKTMGGVMEKECSPLLSFFFASIRK